MLFGTTFGTLPREFSSFYLLVRSVHYRQTATDMTIVSCQTRSELSNDTTIAYVN